MSDADRDAALSRPKSETTRLEDLGRLRPRPIEAIFENLQVKRDLYSALDQRLQGEPRFFASNTSTLSITEIAGGCGRRRTRSSECISVYLRSS